MSHIFKPLQEILGNPDGDFLYVVTTVDTDDPENTVTELYRADSTDEVMELYIRDNSGAEPEESHLDPVAAWIRENWEMTILCNLVGEIS